MLDHVKNIITYKIIFRNLSKVSDNLINQGRWSVQKNEDHKKFNSNMIGDVDFRFIYISPSETSTTLIKLMYII